MSGDDTPTSHDGAPDGERFYQGTILRVYAGSQSGVVRTGNGREVTFVGRDVLLLGTAHGFAALREGMRVGFDLGWTSRGVRVTVLRVYESDSGS